MACAHRSYVAELFFADLELPTSGRLCAIDIDGVLETRWLPYPGLGPAGALALRGLTLGGFRPVLVTGRSLDDLRARCRAYRLAGGIAEYGAVLYDHEAGQTASLLPESARADLEALRATLLYTPGVYVDPDYRHGVRAYSSDGGGGLEPALASWALDQAGVGGRVREIPGELQTDFMAEGIDKGTGLSALRDRLTPDEDVELAVGDSDSDLPMLTLARRRFAPANATSALREARGVRVTRAPYQAGLLSAAKATLGHGPRRRRSLRRPDLPADARVLLRVLAAHDAGRAAKLGHGLALAWLTRKDA
jgi:hydroxymethylpyrimidine pyrophosphatase-like HAD family hydrolase